MPGRKGVKRSVRTANIDIEPEDLLDDDPIDIARIPSQNMRFVESSKENLTTESNDLVALRNYFDTKFNELEAKITNDAQAVSTDLDEKFNSYITTMAEDNELKNDKLEQTLKQKLKKEVSLSFRNKGNKQQYEFNLEQLAKLEEAKTLLEIGSVRRLTKKIDEVISDIQKRNKLIRLADRSAGGWMTVQEYMPDELASDSDDSRKMRQAERKLAFSKKPSSTFLSATQFQQFNSGNATPSYAGNQFRNAPLSSQRQGWNPLQPNSFGRFQNPNNHCYNCGELGHWKHSCPQKNIIQQTRGQPQQDGQK